MGRAWPVLGVALLALACEGRPTDLNAPSQHSFEIDLAAAMEASSNAQQVGAPLPASVMLFWENADGLFSDTVVVQGTRATFTLKDLSRGRTTFWAGAASGAGTILYWSPRVVADVDDDFNIGLTLQEIFPIPELTLLTTGTISSADPTQPIVDPRQTIPLVLSNMRPAADVGVATAANHPVAMEWWVEHEDIVSVDRTSGTLVPGATVPLNIALAKAPDAPLSTTVFFKFRFGADTLQTKLVLLQEPDLKMTKTTNGSGAARQKPGPILRVGDTVTFTYVIRNNGQVPLRINSLKDKITLQDGSTQTIFPTCSRPLATDLSPGDSLVCMASDTVVQNAYKNVGIVQAVSPFGDTLTTRDSNHYVGIPLPSARGTLNAYVLVNGMPSGVAPGPSVNLGSPIIWTYIVMNTDTVPVTNVTITDSQLGQVCQQFATVPPGGEVRCTVSATAAPGQYSTVAQVRGVAAGGTEPFVYRAFSYYFGRTTTSPFPGIHLEKTTNGVDADVGIGPAVPVGDPVLWTYTVTNVGNMTLNNVRVVDSDQSLVPDCPDLNGGLAIGASITCVADAPAAPLFYGNLGTVTATAANGATVMATDSSHYHGVAPSSSAPR